MTPLQVCALVLAEAQVVRPPSTADARALRRWLKAHAGTPRERELVSYLIAACGRSLGNRGGGGSLKHVLWWLRDYARRAYPTAAKEILSYLLNHPEVPLHDVIDHVRFVPAAASFVDAIRNGADSETLARTHLNVRQAGRWSVVINRTTINLLSAAMRYTAAQVYVAVSARGAVIKVRRRVSFPLTSVVAELGDGWAHPYPDLAVRRGPADDEDLERILEVIEGR
jgi:hypothetical protein